MRYYSETDVKEMIDLTVAHEEDISNYIPQLSDYQSIEIPDKHGKIIDGTKLCEGFKGECWEELLMFVSNAPTILEASE